MNSGVDRKLPMLARRKRAMPATDDTVERRQAFNVETIDLDRVACFARPVPRSGVRHVIETPWLCEDEAGIDIDLSSARHRLPARDDRSGCGNKTVDLERADHGHDPGRPRPGVVHIVRVARARRWKSDIGYAAAHAFQ